VERGLYVSIIGGCHDCHTEGYSESGGKIDPSKALKGNSIGWRGPWDVVYAANLRATAYIRDEDQFLEKMKSFEALPPMPWYNVGAMQDSDLRSLYHYIISLGKPGESPPTLVSVGEPKTPYITISPPTMPKS
jgi:Cytochrome c